MKISDKNKHPLIKYLFRPAAAIRSNEKTLKKVGIVALSILVGIFSAFIPHIVCWYKDRKITVLTPQKKEPLPFIEPKPPSIEPKAPSEEVKTSTPPFIEPKPPIIEPKPPSIEPKAPSEEVKTSTPPFIKPKPPLIEEPLPILTPAKKIFQRAFEKTKRVQKQIIPTATQTFNKDSDYGRTKGLVTPRTLVHITGHSFGGNTSLEGSTHEEILNYMVNYLGNRASGNFKGIAEKLWEALALAEEKDLNEFQNAVRGLVKEGNPFLVPFGWTSAPAGHAMYLEMRPESDTHCTVRVFNLGGGSGYHLRSGEKQMPFLDWKGVEIDRFTSGEFLQGIFELNNRANTNDNESTNYSEKEIYQSCKKLLNPKKEEVKLPDEVSLEKWMSPQDIGICAWKSLAAFLFTELPKNDYKQLIAEIKVDAVYQFALKNRDLGTFGSEALFEESLSSTSRYIDKQIQQGWIKTDYREIALKKLQDAQKLWQKGDLETPQEECSYTSPEIKTNRFKKIFSGSETKSLRKDELNLISSTSYITLNQIQQLIPSKNLSKVHENFAKLSNLLESKDLWKTEGLAIHQGLFEFLRGLPLENTDWEGKVTKQQAEEILKHSLKIAEISFWSWNTIPTNKVMQPEQLYIFKKLQKVQQNLTQILFKDYICGHLFYTDPTEYDYLLPSKEVSLNASFAQELKGLATRDDPMKQSRSLELNRGLFPNHELKHSNFWSVLKIKSPTYVKELWEKHASAPEEELVLHALTDENLPELFRALRNISLFLDAASRSANLPLPDSSFSPKITWEKSSEIYYKLTTELINNVGFGLKPLFDNIKEDYFKELEEKASSNNKETNTQTEPFSAEALKKRSPEESRALLRIFASNNLVHNDLLAYCKEHPSAISEPDFQRIFIRALMKGDPGEQFVHLQNYLQETLQSHLRSDNLQTTCFLLRAIRYAQWRFTENPEMPDSHFQIIKELKIRAKDDPALRLLHLEELACLSRKGSGKPWENEFEMAKNVCYLNHYPLHSSEMDPLWFFEIAKLSLLMSGRINNAICNFPKRIPEILKEIDPTTELANWKEESTGVFKSGDNTFYSYSPRFQLEKWKDQEVFIVSQVLENLDFQTLFPNVNRAKWIQNEKESYYEFEDPETKRKTRVSMSGQMSQEIQGKFWIWTSPKDLHKKDDEKFEFLLGSAPITFEYRHFRSEDGKNWISEDPQSHKLVYRTTLKNKETQKGPKFEVSFTEQNVTLRNADGHLLSEPSPLFQGLTHPLAIEEWYDEKKTLQKCHLPTLGLSFKRRGDVLDCNELPGFYLNLKGAKHTGIPHCPLGLVLQNDKGQKKFLLPKFENIYPAKIQQSLLSHLEVEFSLEKEAPGEKKVYVYDISKEGNLHTRNRSAELHLGSIYALYHDYKKSFELLKKHRGQLLSLEENPPLLKSIQTIIDLGKITGDKSPHAKALSVFATVLLLKNRLNYPGQKPSFPVDQETLANNYKNFLKKEHHVHAVHFLKEEELFLIDHLDPEGKNSFFQERKTFLGEEGKKSTPLLNANLSPLEKINVKEALENKSLGQALQVNIKNQMITRPNLAKFLGTYYEMARKPTPEEKKWLEAAIIFSEQIPKEKNLAYFLDLVLKNPDKFEPCPSSKKDEWKITCGKTLDELRTEVSMPEKPAPLPSKISISFFEKPKAYINEAFSFEMRITESASTDELRKNVSELKTEQRAPDTLKAFLTKPEKTCTPLEEAEYKRLQVDLKAYEKTPQVTFEITNKEGLKKALLDMGEEEKLEALKEDILKKANAVSNSPEMQSLKLQGHIKTHTLEDLLINFARQRPLDLQKSNPSLSQNEIEIIYSDVLEYLILATELQQKARVQKALDKNLDTEAASLAFAKRAYGINPKDKKSLAYLSFEYFSDLLLRDEQVKLQDDFLGNLERCYAQEMIMGSGKSKVILILLALLRADGKNISTVVVASSFFKDVALHTSDILQKSFEQTLATVHFDRDTPLTKNSLQEILNTLEAVKTNQNALIVTSKTLQCMVLRFVEEWMLFSASGEEKPSQELDLLKVILAKMQKEGNLLVDELDTVLNVLHTVSFSLGGKEHPTPALLKINQTIYELLYTDPELKKIARLESDLAPESGAPPLTKELYRTELKMKLAQKFLKKVNLENEGLADFICQNPKLETERAKIANSAYQNLESEDKKRISQAALQIGHLLENTLIKTSNEKYGIAEGDLFAIPYSAANTPCKGSEFASHTVTYNYTLQFIAKYGLASSQIRQPLEEVLNRISTDTEGGLEVLLSSWEKKLGIFFSEGKTDWKAVQEKINGDLSLKLAFYEEFILPKMTFYSQKITSNSQNIAETATLIKGFTGTLWNATTFHKKFEAKPEMGTDSKTLALLFSHSNKTALEFEKIDLTNCDMLIDAGGYYKEQDNLQAARERAKSRGMPVVFYHKKEQTITDGTQEKPFKESELKEGQYLTFLDQVNTTGADVPQKAKALGFVTIKAGMLKRDLLQAAWRLRGLAKGQTINWVVDQKTASLIRASLKLENDAKISLPEILRYTIANESEQLANDNYQACLQQVENVKQQLLIKELLSEVPPSDKKKSMEALKSSFCKDETASHPEKHFYSIPEMIDTKIYLNGLGTLVNEEIEKLPISKESKQSAVQEINTIIARYQAPGMLLEKIQSPSATAEESVEIEKETERESQTQVEVEKEFEEKRPSLFRQGSEPKFANIQIKKSGMLALIPKEIPRLSLTTYFNHHPKFEKLDIAKAFSQIDLSLNFLQKDLSTKKKIQNYHLHETYQKEFDYLVFEEGIPTLISQQDADIFLKEKSIFSLKSGEFLKEKEHNWSPQELELLLKIRFLAGFSSYSKEELLWLKQWIQENPGLVDLFKKVIIKNNPARAQEFRGSSLSKLFSRLI